MLFPEPPTTASLHDAQRSLTGSLQSFDALATQASAMEVRLQRMIQDAQCALDDIKTEMRTVEQQIQQTRAYLAPVRKLPSELLRAVFCWAFSEDACVAWKLAAVCRHWRHSALNVPYIWSKIRLLTSQSSSPDTIRLWLERSGPTVPLDVEIYLRVTKSSSDQPNTAHHSRRRLTSPSPSMVMAPFPSNHLPAPPPLHYALPPIQSSPHVVPMPDLWSAPLQSSSEYAGRDKNMAATSWAYIAIYYLVEQMHRWDRFVFRFDKQFPSIGALRNICGDAPLLREFEISSRDIVFFSEWTPWLACPASPDRESKLPKLTSLSLQFTPFKWTSPIFQAGLTNLSLRALPAVHLSLDRLFSIIRANKDTLQYLSFHFQGVTPAVLPLSPLTLPELKELSVGGNHILAQIIDQLTIPCLNELNIDIEPREPLEETIRGLMERAGPSMVIKHLSVAYGFGCGHRASHASMDSLPNAIPRVCTSSSNPPALGGHHAFFYHHGSTIIPWSLLSELNSLESLRLGGASLEGLFSALGIPDVDLLSPISPPSIAGPSSGVSWICPNLRELGLRNCHAHTEAVGKLVQMVEARNPGCNTSPSSSSMVINGVTPKRLRLLEIYECTTMGEDVVHWLQSRLPEVVIPEQQASAGADRAGFM